MRFTTIKKNLIEAVTVASKAVNGKAALVILTHLRFYVANGRCVITGDNIDSRINAYLDVFGCGEDESCDFCILAARIKELIKELPDAPISFEVDDESAEVTIACGDGRFTMSFIDGSQFPDAHQKDIEEENVSFGCSAKDFIAGIDNTIFAAVDGVDLLPQLQGVLLDIMEDNITFVATNSRMLAVYKDKSLNVGMTGRAILPSSVANTLRSICSKDDELRIRLGEKSIVFDTDKFQYSSVLIKGNYPNYVKIIPQNNPIELEINSVEIMPVLKRVAVFADKELQMTKLVLKEGTLKFESKSGGYSAVGQDSIPVDYTGGNITLGINIEYLMTIIESIDKNKILIEMSEPYRPVVFKSAEKNAGVEKLALLMPMSIKDN